jgi:hypothetical protein
MLAVCYYLSSVLEDGPDFSLGASHYSDYLSYASDISTPAVGYTIELGEVVEETWRIKHVTGVMAESIERLLGELPGISGRLY